MVVFGQKFIFSGKSGYIRALWLFEQDCYIRAKWLYSGKVVVFGQKWFDLGESGCIRAKWLYSDKVVLFGQKWL